LLLCPASTAPNHHLSIILINYTSTNLPSLIGGGDMAKKRKSVESRLDEVDRTMYSTFCTTANSLSHLYTHAMNQQKLSFQAGERHALVCFLPSSSSSSSSSFSPFQIIIQLIIYYTRNLHCFLLII